MSGTYRPTAMSGGTTAPAWTSRRDRNVGVLVVPCPTCEAREGEPCVSSKGGRTQHAPRRRMALRAESTPYDVADVTFVRGVTPAGRRAIRKRAGLTLEALGAEVLGGVSSAYASQVELDPLPNGGSRIAAYGRWLRDNQSA